MDMKLPFSTTGMMLHIDDSMDYEVLSSSIESMPKSDKTEDEIVLEAMAHPIGSLISFSINGIICLLGTGLVWSEQIITTFSFPFASSESFGEPIGCAIASRTISSSVLSLFGMDSMDEDKTS